MSHGAIDRRRSNAVAVVREILEDRTARPWIAGMAGPLAMVLAALTEPVLLVPVVAAIWWFTPGGRFWVWVSYCGRGLISIEWALVGISAMQTWPGQQVPIAWTWMGSAVILWQAASIQRSVRRE